MNNLSPYPTDLCRITQGQPDCCWTSYTTIAAAELFSYRTALLNEDNSLWGGATGPGVVAELIDELIAAGYGILQLPCPERLAWTACSNATDCGSTTPKGDCPTVVCRPRVRPCRYGDHYPVRSA